jgi:hypothetical protein
MRMLMKVTIPGAEGNAAIINGSLGSTIGSILADLKPESVYFLEENGLRTGIIVFNLENTSQLPAVAEPWFLAFNAKVELHPTMTMEDLKNSAPGMESAVKKYSKSVHPVGR